LDHLEALSINFYDIIKEINNESVYNIIISNIDKDINGTFYNYLGLLYMNGLYIEKSERRGIFYYNKSIKKENINAMNNLGHYYEKQKDYKHMMEYYLMAIEKGSSTSMYNLAVYYKNKKDYINMEKYYLMAIEKGNINAMNNLGLYYYDIKDYINMEKYLLMAIEKGNFEYLDILLKHYKDNNIKLIQNG
jgi:TPR repeat protein